MLSQTFVHFETMQEINVIVDIAVLQFSNFQGKTTHKDINYKFAKQILGWELEMFGRA